MPAYTFEAVDANGETHKGVIDADTARAARGMLRARSLVPLAVEPAAQSAQGGGGGKGLNVTLWGGRVFSATALGVWTRQLAGLVAAGMPLERALSALADEAENDKLRNLVATLRSEVNAGSAFARALAQFPREFSTSYSAVVAAGEQSGQLGTVLERLADDLEGREALRNKLIAAALYPAIVTLVAIVIVVFLVSYVVPQVAGVFEGSERALPTLTVIMMGISAFVRAWGWYVLAVLVLGVICLVIARRQESVRLRMDAAVLRLPVLGRLARGFNATRFAGTLAMLAGSGVPILRALQTAAETLNNRALREDALDALVRVREGAPLASALASKKRFPPLLSMFARLGEQTGQLPQMLQRAADQLGAEVQRRAMSLATVLEPLLIVGMGLIVMLIVLAVLLPIIQLNQLVT
ncbi:MULTISPECIES: type II secretion system inner membrane protein GspF [Hydrogenophaga]|uniref:General secretion pathway protein F n=1 Tax=Hydrogenophaga intermedia TaxID=65786 RepID=A0A1L1P803_HYDIT|nr:MULTISPECIES: type II secretion system inner membrane protein GspF [Hydrogenophaga]AOS77829.1 type II secretion system protein GspF [Hydrogenophaga sp. PBC]TMU75983.1 type II secretion system protein GspF [Hydrogenophaga intermedia]CDN85932.1 General secretion pathway protein F [Hydrogenophaga intermedia]